MFVGRIEKEEGAKDTNPFSTNVFPFDSLETVKDLFIEKFAKMSTYGEDKVLNGKTTQHKIIIKFEWQNVSMFRFTPTTV